MSQAQFDQAFRDALRHHREGRLSEAEAAYRQAIALRADPDLLQMLGVLAAQRRRTDEGIALIRQAIAMSPGKAGYYGNLGFVLANSGKKHEAAAAFQQMVSLNPQDPDAHLNLATALRETGRPEEAVLEYREAFNRKAPPAQMLNALAMTLHELKRYPEAAECYSQAAALRPDPGVFHNLSAALSDMGRHADAETAIRKALSLRPDLGLSWFKLGNLLQSQRRHLEAVEAFKKCLAIEPSNAARNNMGSALRDAGLLDESLEHFRILESSGYGGAELRFNLGRTLWDIGDLDEAAMWFRRALELKPDAIVESGLIFTLHFLPETQPALISESLAQWNEKYARLLAVQILPHTNSPLPDRRLRVGYVARHLGNHPLSRFLLRLLSHHDRERFEVFVYCDEAPDHISDRLRENAHVWRTLPGISDEELSQRIRADGVDILVDLMMHVGKHRLLTFARKPAPVQVTYLAHPGSTGLRTMDYRLTDPYLDPPGDPLEPLYVEKTVRLPHTFWCYLEPPEAPPVGPLPADTAGVVTFGCLNSGNKINDNVVALWARILSQSPESRLTLFSVEGLPRNRVMRLLTRHDVDPARVRFVGRQSLSAYFAEYNRIDIALDPFPYPGGTTTCDALWMGVPVITLGGNTPLSRGGVSILSNIGLQSLITWDPDQYVQTALALSRDLPAIRSLRASLRDRMRQSPLMDAPQFARDVEAAYQTMWRKWCEELPRAGSRQ